MRHRFEHRISGIKVNDERGTMKDEGKQNPEARSQEPEGKKESKRFQP
jgi:hypothetical protein